MTEQDGGKTLARAVHFPIANFLTRALMRASLNLRLRHNSSIQENKTQLQVCNIHLSSDGPKYNELCVVRTVP